MNLSNWAKNPNNLMQFVELPDYDMMVDPTDTNITPPLVKNLIWEPKSTAIFRELIKPGDVVIDCGAHWGYYTLMAAMRGATVYSFEANPSSFLLLSVNVALNEQYIKTTSGSVRIFPLAVWDKTVPINFVPEIGTTGGSHVIAECITDLSKYEKGIIVPAVSLDEIFESGEKIDFIKVDCEQSDRFVLKGARRILEEQHPKLMSEHPPIELLTELGYKQTHEFTDEQTTHWEKT